MRLKIHLQMLAHGIQLKQGHTPPLRRVHALFGADAVFQQLSPGHLQSGGGHLEQIVGRFEHCLLKGIQRLGGLLDLLAGVSTQGHFRHNAMKGCPGHERW